jgi:(2Fe-2S) ferredoxin
MTGPSKRIWVCLSGRYCCQRQPEPDKVLAALQEAVIRHDAGDKLEVVGGGCLGMCEHGPNAMVINGRNRIGYSHLCPADADEIVAAHKDGDTPVERLRQKRGST